MFGNFGMARIFLPYSASPGPPPSQPETYGPAARTPEAAPTGGYQRPAASAAREQRVPRAVIFVVGGATYEEARDIAELNRAAEGGRTWGAPGGLEL